MTKTDQFQRPLSICVSEGNGFEAKAIRNASAEPIVETFYYLSNGKLASQLLGLCRAARSDSPFFLSETSRNQNITRITTYLRQVVPAIAKRLSNKIALQDIEATTQVANLQIDQLRIRAGRYILNTSFLCKHWPLEEPSQPTAMELLTRNPSIGNPVAFALDRLYIPAQDETKQDLISHCIAQHAQNTIGKTQLAWSPELPLHFEPSLPEDHRFELLDPSQNPDAILNEIG